jgi:hypothetical protein
MQNEISRRPENNSKHHRSHDLSKNAAIKALWHERENFFNFIRFLLPFQLVSTENVNDPRASTFCGGGEEKFFKLLDSYSSCWQAEVLASVEQSICGQCLRRLTGGREHFFPRSLPLIY